MESFNTSFLDGWSLIHALAGYTMGILELKRSAAYSLIVGAEIVENLILRGNFEGFFEEGGINIASDLIIGSAFYELAKKYF